MCAPSSSPGCAGDPIPNPNPSPSPFLPFPPSLGGRPARTGLSRAVIFLPTSSPVCFQDCKAGARSCWLITRAKPLSCPKYPRDPSSSGPERLRFSDLGKGRAQKVSGQPQGELKQLETRRRRRSGESKPTCAPSSSLCLCWSRWPGMGEQKANEFQCVSGAPASLIKQFFLLQLPSCGHGHLFSPKKLGAGGAGLSCSAQHGQGSAWSWGAAKEIQKKQTLMATARLGHLRCKSARGGEDLNHESGT